MESSRQESVIVQIASISGGTQQILRIFSGKEEVINRLLGINGKENTVVRDVTPEDYEFKAADARYFHVYENNHIRMVKFDDIVYLEAARCYCEIHRKNEKPVVVSKPMSEVARHLPTGKFIRIHKSYILNCEYLDDIFGSKIILPDRKTTLPIGREYHQNVLQSLNIINSQNKKFSTSECSETENAVMVK